MPGRRRRRLIPGDDWSGPFNHRPCRAGRLVDSQREEWTAWDFTMVSLIANDLCRFRRASNPPPLKTTGHPALSGASMAYGIVIMAGRRILAAHMSPGDVSFPVTVHTSNSRLGVGWLARLAWTASVTKANTLRFCRRQVSITISSVSTKRLPEAVCVPKDSVRRKQPGPPTGERGKRPRAVAKTHATNTHWHCSSARRSRAAEMSADGQRDSQCAGIGRPACRICSSHSRKAFVAMFWCLAVNPVLQGMWHSASPNSAVRRLLWRK